MCGGGAGSIPGADKLDSGFHPFVVGKIRSNQYVAGWQQQKTTGSKKRAPVRYSRMDYNTAAGANNYTWFAHADALEMVDCYSRRLRSVLSSFTFFTFIYNILLGWGSKIFRALVGLAINICRAAVCAVPYTLVLSTSCQQCKLSSGHRVVNVRVAIENIGTSTLTF